MLSAIHVKVPQSDMQVACFRLLNLIANLIAIPVFQPAVLVRNASYLSVLDLGSSIRSRALIAAPSRWMEPVTRTSSCPSFSVACGNLCLMAIKASVSVLYTWPTSFFCSVAQRSLQAEAMILARFNCISGLKRTITWLGAFGVEVAKLGTKQTMSKSQVRLSSFSRGAKPDSPVRLKIRIFGLTLQMRKSIESVMYYRTISSYSAHLSRTFFSNQSVHTSMLSRVWAPSRCNRIPCHSISWHRPGQWVLISPSSSCGSIFTSLGVCCCFPDCDNQSWANWMANEPFRRIKLLKVCQIGAYAFDRK